MAKRVAQRVRAHLLLKTGAARVALNDLVQALTRQAAAAALTNSRAWTCSPTSAGRPRCR